MKWGQAELLGIGWKDTSPTHLTSLVMQLDSEYEPVDQNKKNISTAAAAER